MAKPSLTAPVTIWLAFYWLMLGWSASRPADLFTWFLEVLPALIALPLLAYTRATFPLTPLLYILLLLHCAVLFIGGHYTYAHVPWFDPQVIGFGVRNNFDKVGHFMQGLVPAVLAREIIIRRHIVNGRFWTGFMSVAICLAFSACYELLEWLIAISTGSAAEAFLGTQGDPWDTQTDMAMALLGALSSILLLAPLHQRQLKQFL